LHGTGGFLAVDALLRDVRRFAGDAGYACVSIATAGWLLLGLCAQCQVMADARAMGEPAATAIAVARPAAEKHPVESEIAVMGMVPYGDYRLISTTVRCDAWTVGVEYDRNSFGHFLLGARWDYVGEVLPFVLLSEPAKADYWGNPESPYQQHLHGLSILPIGWRWIWRANKPLKFYVSTKLGAVAFNQKALSLNASYVNFNIQAAFGMQYRLSDRIDLKVEPFEFFHVSNGYLAASNPGMDELGSKFGISYHLGRRGER
jgi:hypothetical protein